MQYQDEITCEVIRLHTENRWFDSVIAKVVRRRFGMEIDVKEIKNIIRQYDSLNGIDS